MDLEKEIQNILDNSPTLGNSKFQLDKFVINKQQTTGRVYRQAILELRERFIALKRARINKKKIEAEISLLEKKLSKQVDENKKTIIECDIEEKIIDLESQEKLVKDAIEMCNYLYSGISQMKPISSEEFEKEEEQYWTKRLVQDARLSIAATGTISSDIASSLESIGINPIIAQAELQLQNNTELALLLEAKKEEKKNA